MEQNGKSEHRQHHEHENLPVNYRSKTVDRTKRDEWSKDAVAALLDAYEAKWVLRNKAKLKGNDWEDVAQRVCAREGGSRAFKTQSQCKNKIEALKKRYRSEATSVGASTWGLFARMDVMLRCSGGLGAGTKEQQEQTYTNEVLPEMEDAGPEPQLHVNQYTIHHRRRQQVAGKAFQRQKNGNLRQLQERNQEEAEEDDASNTLLHTQPVMKKEELSFTSKIVHAMEEPGGNAGGASKRRKKSSSREVADSFCWFAESILKLEQAKLENLKNSQRLRAEAEAKRLDMELQRTQIIVQTQLQIASLLSANKRPSHKQSSSNNDTAPPSSVRGAALISG